MKCVYHPTEEAEHRCYVCGVHICNECQAEASMKNDLCQTCARQRKIYRFYQIYRYSAWGLGFVWVIIAFLIFTGDFLTKLSYGLYGLLVIWILNTIVGLSLNRIVLFGLQLYQKVFVGLYRYAVTGQNFYMNQALKTYLKIDDITPYRDALFDQIVSILILQPYSLPSDWTGYFAEKFLMKESEIIDGIVTYGTDVFYENIFKQHHYQAIEPLMEILEKTENDELYNKLVDEILLRLETVDLKKVNRQQAIIPGIPAQNQAQLDKDSLRDKAFLIELKLMDLELEELLKRLKRDKDYHRIFEFIENFELPRVPKNTFEAVKQMGLQQSQAQQGQQRQQTAAAQTAAPTESAALASQAITAEAPAKATQKACAECGQSFDVITLKDYTFEKVKVKVCSSCEKILEEDGHREPKKLADLRK